ncbi:MAG: hypothetical protein K6U74_07440, partial [Firmicutes bacterium]|nr:hypothetical protein [Bacillota bacterium]
MVNALAKAELLGVQLVATDTDWASVRSADAHSKIEHRGASVIGMGTGSNPGWAQSCGEVCAEVCADALRKALDNPSFVSIVAGMGGGAGVGASPVIARLAAEAGVPVAAVVTLPAQWEGPRRDNLAKEGLEALRRETGAVLAVSLVRIQKEIDGSTPLEKFFDIVQLLLCDCIAFLLGQKDTAEFTGLRIGGLEVITGCN